MNRGSATKWAEMLESGSFKLNDGSALKHQFEDRYCIAGVLEELATQSWTLNETIAAYEHKEKGSHTISKECIKRCKVKTDFNEVYEFHKKHANESPQFFAKWILENYERF